jgi:hypothetical protein
MGEGAQNSHAVSGCATLQEHPQVQLLGTSWVFMEVLLQGVIANSLSGKPSQACLSRILLVSAQHSSFQGMGQDPSGRRKILWPSILVSDKVGRRISLWPARGRRRLQVRLYDLPQAARSCSWKPIYIYHYYQRYSKIENKKHWPKESYIYINVSFKARSSPKLFYNIRVSSPKDITIPHLYALNNMAYIYICIYILY